jgi:hypothetical protein
MKVIREIKLNNELPEEVKREVNRISSNNLLCEKWLNRYVEGCKELYAKRKHSYKKETLYKTAENWINSNDSEKIKNGQLLRWATANAPCGKDEDKVYPSLTSCWRQSHGETHIENPSVAITMVLQNNE